MDFREILVLLLTGVAGVEVVDIDEMRQPRGVPLLSHLLRSAHAFMPPVQLSRRHALASAALLAPMAATADAPKVWLSGKSDPLRPTNKEKPDGTKKDGKYLSCLNDCVPRKMSLNQQGSREQPLEKGEALDLCQLECCATYEQCTYTIRK